MRTAKILIVDDEPRIRSFLKDMLTGEERKITTAADGREALDYIADQEFDLVLLDLKMRAIGGMDVLAALHERWPDTAVIVLTAHASLESAVEAVRQGAYDYLFKPCKTNELRESVRAALRERRHKVRQRAIMDRLRRTLSDNLEALRTLESEPSSTPALKEKSPQTRKEGKRFLEWGGLIIDRTRHVATLDGHLLELSPTQFDLLAYLMGEAPRVISPQELVCEVRNYEVEPDPEESRNIVCSHIYHIRESVEAVGGRRDIIRTVRGVGYTMNEVLLHNF
jgi:DNA-binding response OmpR family regulator